MLVKVERIVPKKKESISLEEIGALKSELAGDLGKHVRYIMEMKVEVDHFGYTKASLEAVVLTDILLKPIKQKLTQMAVKHGIPRKEMDELAKLLCVEL